MTRCLANSPTTLIMKSPRKMSGFVFNIQFSPDYPPPVYIALQAVVSCDFYIEQTAWARYYLPYEYDGANWAEYF